MTNLLRKLTAVAVAEDVFAKSPRSDCYNYTDPTYRARYAWETSIFNASCALRGAGLVGLADDVYNLAASGKWGNASNLVKSFITRRVP